MISLTEVSPSLVIPFSRAKSSHKLVKMFISFALGSYSYEMF